MKIVQRIIVMSPGSSFLKMVGAEGESAADEFGLSDRESSNGSHPFFFQI